MRARFILFVLLVVTLLVANMFLSVQVAARGGKVEDKAAATRPGVETGFRRGREQYLRGEEIDPDVPLVWVPTDPPIGVYTMVVDPQQPSNIYVGGSSLGPDLSYSRDYGETWHLPATELVGGSVEALAIDPHSPNYLYAGLRTGHFARSQNRARDWEEVGDRLLGDSSVSAIFVHPISQTLVLAGTAVGIPTIYRSTDRFDTWDVIPLTGPNNREIVQILHHPGTPERIYAVVPGEGVFVSEDWGMSWTNTGVDVDAMLIDPNDPDVMYRLDCTPYRSDDGGAHWEQLPFAIPYCFQRMHMDPQNSNYLYLGSMYHVPARSLDGGQSWQMMYGFGAEGNPASSVLAIDPQDSTRVYISDGYYSVYLDEALFLPLWE